jgi:hypothetical protein
MKMSTYFALMAEFGTADIPLDLVCAKYFGLNADQAARRAALNRLPIPAFRASRSQKAPWLIAAKVLADHIDAALETASVEWLKSQSA